MISVTVSAWSLEVNVQSSENHPDALTDVANRATSVFASALSSMSTMGISLFDADMIDEILGDTEEF